MLTQRVQRETRPVGCLLAGWASQNLPRIVHDGSSSACLSTEPGLTVDPRHAFFLVDSELCWVTGQAGSDYHYCQRSLRAAADVGLAF